MEGKDEGAVYEQFLTVGQLVDSLVNWGRHERVCVCRVGRFGGEEFWPALAIGQMDGGESGERPLCLYCIEGRDDD